MAATMLLAGCSGSPAASPARRIDQSACVEVEASFYYPTVPPDGYHVARSSAADLEALLPRASLSGLRAEAEPLHRAIASDDESAMVKIFQHLQLSVCPTIGITPVT